MASQRRTSASRTAKLADALARFRAAVESPHCTVDLDQRDKYGATLLMRAVRNRDVGMVEYLVKLGAPLNVVANNWTALELAARVAHDQLVRLLLANGARVRGVDEEEGEAEGAELAQADAAAVQRLVQLAHPEHHQRLLKTVQLGMRLHVYNLHQELKRQLGQAAPDDPGRQPEAAEHVERLGKLYASSKNVRDRRNLHRPGLGIGFPRDVLRMVIAYVKDPAVES